MLHFTCQMLHSTLNILNDTFREFCVRLSNFINFIFPMLQPLYFDILVPVSLMLHPALSMLLFYTLILHFTWFILHYCKTLLFIQVFGIMIHTLIETQNMTLLEALLRDYGGLFKFHGILLLFSFKPGPRPAQGQGGQDELLRGYWKYIFQESHKN